MTWVDFLLIVGASTVGVIIKHLGVFYLEKRRYNKMRKTK